MKKYISIIIFCFINIVNIVYAENLKEYEGFWLMSENSKGRMKIVRTIVVNNEFYAYGIDLHDNNNNNLDKYNPNKDLRNKELKGLVFIYDMKFENGKWQTGKIYHTDQGGTYYAKISLSDDKSKLYLKASLDKSGVLGATVEWIRLSDKESSQYNDIPIDKLRKVDGKKL